ncbi:hypothetical protein [Blastococcus sp. SYSU DS0617]
MAAANEAEPVEQVTAFLEGLAAEAPSDGAAPGLPAFEVPPEIRAAFQQLADAAMLPENCVDGVADAIELILGGLIALPLELADALAALLELLGGGEGLPLPDELAVIEDLLDQLLGGLAGAAPGAVDESAAADQSAAEGEAAPEGAALPLVGDVEGLLGGEGAPEGEVPAEETPAPETPELPTLTLVDGLVALGEALAACIPAPPTEEPEPEPETPVVHPTPAQPAPHAPEPVAQPVAYLGYAPTGADAPRADDTSVPLTALGGGLVLVAAGAAGYGMRGRAVRTRD